MHPKYLTTRKWCRKNPPKQQIEGRESRVSYKRISLRSADEDRAREWGDTYRDERRDNSWDYSMPVEEFIDQFRYIFEWDDSVSQNSHIRMQEARRFEFGLEAFHSYCQQNSKAVLASIDWDTRWSCALPDSADEISNYGMDDVEAQESLRSSSPVILGLPVSKDDAVAITTHCLPLPADIGAIPPSGWGDEDSKAGEAVNEQPEAGTFYHPNTPHGLPLLVDIGEVPSSEWRDEVSKLEEADHMQPEAATSYHPVNVGYPSLIGDLTNIIPTGWGDDLKQPETETNSHGSNVEYPNHSYPTYLNGASETAGLPQNPNSYKHIIASGWEEDSVV